MHDKLFLMTADFQQVFDKSPFPCALLSRDLIILACNDAYEANAGRPRHGMLSCRIFDLFPAQESGQRDALERSFSYVLESRETHRIPLLRYPIAVAETDEDKYEDRYWTISNVPLLGDDGEVRFILHYPTEITELTLLRRTSQAQLPALVTTAENASGGAHSRQEWFRDVHAILSAERERLHQLFQQAPGFICVLRGPHHVYELANDAYYQLIGHRQILGHALAEVLPEVVVQGYLEKLDRVFATGKPFIGRAMAIQLQRMPGSPLEQRHIDLVYQPILDPAGQVSGIFVQGHDVTEAHQLAREVSYQAAHDPLTGLYNRREFARRTAEFEGTDGPHTLLYMDLDHFKIVNDRCGHAAGDALLLQVAEVLQQHVGENDLLARLGGDEFALILRDCPESTALERAHELRRRIHDIPFIWNARRYGVTLSVGLVCFGGQDAPSLTEVLSLADAACFLAKEKGRNRIQVSHAGDEDVTRQQRDMDWADRIKDCIREDRIVLHGQRLVTLQAQHQDTFECLEVLARLLDAEGNLVFPGSFIPAAERFGLINELDRHILGKAFSKLQGLSSAQRDKTRYFVNVSGITLSTPGFSDYIEQLLDRYCDVRPGHICIEVTETAAIANLTYTAATVRQLTERGFRFALDDFGSGMSSFAYLEHLPVHYLKIDGGFIKGILTRPAGAVIVEAVAKVARAMNIQTVAESVETLELLPYLRGLDIDYGQGFALHRPEPL